MQNNKISASRIAGMLLGCVVISLGIAFFKQSGLGNDSITALNLRTSELLGISLGTMNLMANTLFFIVEILWGRKYIGLGTFFNWVTIGYIVTGLSVPGLPRWPETLGFIHLPALVSVAAASIFTAPLGARVAHAINTKPLKRLFACNLFVLASYMLYRAVSTL